MSTTTSTPSITPELPTLPGMLPPQAAKPDLQRWEDEGGKPALSMAERKERLAADRALRRERWQSTLGSGLDWMRTAIRARPLLAATAALVVGVKLGRRLYR